MSLLVQTKINRTATYILLFFLSHAFIACGHGSFDKSKPLAVRGILDLTATDLEKQGPIDLNGEWEFCRDCLTGPSDFSNQENRKNRGFIKVPGLWENQKVNGAALPGKGSGAYRLRVLCGPERKPMTMRINRITSSYRLWINGSLADKRGMAEGSSKTREDYIFIHSKSAVTFTPLRGDNEIILNVFNKHYRSGGIDRPLQLMDAKTWARKEKRDYTVSMLVVGLLLFASIYNILFYLFRREERAPLYLGFFCLVLAINIFNLQIPLLSGGFSYPGNPYIVDFITTMLCVPLCIMTIKALYTDEFALSVVRISQAVAAISIVPLFFVDFKASELIFRTYFIFFTLIIFYCVYVLIRAILNRRDDAFLFLAGFIPVFIGSINDMLYASWIIDTANIAQYGVVALCISTTMVISRRFSRAFRKVEELSKDLEANNLTLKKMDRLKDRFLANTSHELRTPLHGMIGLSESMLVGAAGSLTPGAHENLSLISSCGHRLANMVNDLLDMARIEEEGLNLNIRPLDIYSLSEMVVKLSVPLIGDKPIQIINRIAPDIPRVRADEDRIRQVMYNLMGNAIKFTNKGTIELSARPVSGAESGSDIGSGDAVEVSISDTGIGVPDEYKEMIFEAYEQVEKSDTRSHPGTGLGLAIAKQIIILHNGIITVTSREEGGTVFSFTLPVTADPVPDIPGMPVIESTDETHIDHETLSPYAGSADLIDEPFTGNPVFLVVDDDPVNVRILKGYLESKGSVVKTASDGISALDIIERDSSIDLVLLDIMMPVMSGYDACRRIRLNRPSDDLPVIMLTAKNMLSDIDAAFDAGANDYIIKPFHLRELHARVSTMLALKNVRRSAARGITIRDRSRAYSIDFSDIVYITSHLKNIIIHTDQRDIEVPLLMKEIIHRLPPDIFVRIHKSHMINIKYVHSLSHVLSGRYKVSLMDEDDTELPVGPAFLDGLRKKL